MTARLTCYPPHLHQTAPVSVDASTALSQIQTFLAETTENAYLHPNCTFTEAGLQVSNITQGGIILHQLRRVEQGLRGIVLQPMLEDEIEELEGLDDTTTGDLGEDMPERNNTRPYVTTAATSEQTWAEDDLGVQETGAEPEFDMLNGEPAANYQEQLGRQNFGTFEGEIGKRTNVVADGPGAKPPRVIATDTASKKRRLEQMQNGTPHVDKEARKRAKKEKQRMRAQERSKPHGLSSDAVEETVMEESGPVFDETREEFDDRGPASSYIPQKVSSTIVQPLANGDSAPSPRKDTKKQRPMDDARQTNVQSQINGGTHESQETSDSGKPATQETTASNGTHSQEVVSSKQEKARQMDAPKTPKKLPKMNGVAPAPPTEDETLDAKPKKARKKKKVDEPAQSALDMPLNTPALNGGRKSKSIMEYDKDAKSDLRAERKRQKRMEKEVKLGRKNEGHMDRDGSI